MFEKPVIAASIVDKYHDNYSNAVKQNVNNTKFKYITLSLLKQSF